MTRPPYNYRNPPKVQSRPTPAVQLSWRCGYEHCDDHYWHASTTPGRDGSRHYLRHHWNPPRQA